MKILFCSCCFLLLHLSVLAQTVVRGVVHEADGPRAGTPLPGAIVRSSQTPEVAATDSAGRFELRGPAALTSLTVQLLGYRPRTVPVTGEDELIIGLSADQAILLGEAVVTTKYYREYTAQTVSSALRLQAPLLQLSQHIQAITPEVLFDQGSFNTTESVTRNVSGVVRNEISNNLGPNFYMRGGQVAPLRNGVDLTPYYRGPVPDDAALVERIEFIKGPSLFMNNIGDPAGSFNIVTKQPTGTPRYVATAMLGSYRFYRLGADLDGKLDKAGKLLYRFNAAATRTNSFVPGDYNRRVLVSPVLRYQLSARTALTAEYTWQTFRYGLYSPIVMTPNGFGSLPRNFTISEPSLGPIRARNQSGFLTFTHQLRPDWELMARGAFLQETSEGRYLWVTGVNAANPNVLLRNPKYDLDLTRVTSQQAFVKGRFQTGPVGHQLLAGVDVNQKKFLAIDYLTYDVSTGPDGTTRPVYYPLDVTNPVYGAAVPGYTSPNGLAGRNTEQTIRYASAYALDELALLGNRLRLTPGLRYTAVQSGNEVLGARSSSHDRVVTPRLGLSYSLRPDFTVYGLYDRTLAPQGGITREGAPLVPLRGINRELGLKKNWLAGRWTSVLALYHTTRSSIAAVDPSNSLYRLQVGRNHARGAELDVVGQVVRGLNLVVNYAYTDARIDQDTNPLLVGARPPLFVKHVQNSWLNYELPARLVRGLSLSVGYQYQGGRGGRYAVATPYAIPDYFRLDGGAGWQSAPLKVNLVVNNLLNRTLLGTPWLRNGLYYWIPQAGTSGRLSVSYVL